MAGEAGGCAPARAPPQAPAQAPRSERGGPSFSPRERAPGDSVPVPGLHVAWADVQSA